MLVNEDVYIERAVHIGGKFIIGELKDYILKKRPDGVYIMNLEKIDQKLTELLNRVARVPLSKLLIVPSRYHAKIAATKFKELFPEVNVLTERYIPGSLTNPSIKSFIEPELILVIDPNSEKVLIQDANRMKIPVVGLVDTDTNPHGLDQYAPMNNRGRSSLALFFWLLAREIYMKQGRIKSYDEFKRPISFFEE